jgi:hypothetical protein
MDPNDWPLFALLATGLVAGGFFTGWWVGWAISVGLAGIPFVVGLSAPIESDDTRLLTGALFVLPYAAAFLTGWVVRALVRAGGRRRRRARADNRST